MVCGAYSHLSCELRYSLGLALGLCYFSHTVKCNTCPSEEAMFSFAPNPDGWRKSTLEKSAVCGEAGPQQPCETLFALNDSVSFDDLLRRNSVIFERL